ncbi:MAG: nucleotidyltransferase [Deltaproteobacteria bacterium]|nr:nucleotidyltransferase [Deltaproteobacteria bacterium]
MDTENLLRSLNAHNVEYVIIGATAFPVHGYARATLDIDLFIRPDPENASRTHRALKDFGYDVADIDHEDLLTNKVLIRQYLVETDIHPFVTGISFDQVWENRVAGRYGSEEVYYASLDDLIIMKKAAGRSKDLEDLRILESLKK